MAIVLSLRLLTGGVISSGSQDTRQVKVTKCGQYEEMTLEMRIFSHLPVMNCDEIISLKSFSWEAGPAYHAFSAAAGSGEGSENSEWGTFWPGFVFKTSELGKLQDFVLSAKENSNSQRLDDMTGMKIYSTLLPPWISCMIVE